METKRLLIFILLILLITSDVTAQNIINRCGNLNTDSLMLLEADYSTPLKFPLGDMASNEYTFSNVTKVIDDDLIVSQGFTLKLHNVDFIMRNCSKIIVERGGRLLIDSSCIGTCDWEGIEVQGNIDGCSNDTLYSQGVVEIKHSTLTGANIGIYAGKRKGTWRDVFYSGGIIRAYHNHFENNYVDIMIQEWCFNAICACLDQDSNRVPAGEAFYHEIVGNYFGPLRQAPVCSYFVDHVIDTVNNFDFNQGICFKCDLWRNAIPLTRCHIIDLSAYPDLFWSNQPPSLPPAWQSLYGYCCKSLWTSHYSILNGGLNAVNPGDNGNCTYDNIFSDSCKNLKQGNLYHDHTR